MCSYWDMGNSPWTTKQIDKTNQFNKTNQINETDRTDEINKTKGDLYNSMSKKKSP